MHQHIHRDLIKSRLSDHNTGEIRRPFKVPNCVDSSENWPQPWYKQILSFNNISIERWLAAYWCRHHVWFENMLCEKMQSNNSVTIFSSLPVCTAPMIACCIPGRWGRSSLQYACNMVGQVNYNMHASIFQGKWRS